MPNRASCSLAALAIMLSGSAGAQPPAPIETREREALAACDSGRVKEGIEILARLWTETLEPAYVYNQGRCYQKSAMPREALGRFREYLRLAPDQGDPVVARAQQYVKDLEAELAQRERVVPAAPVASVAGPPLSADGPRPVYRKPWFWVVAGAVVAGAATTTALLLAGRNQPSPAICPECRYPATTLGGAP